MSQAKLCRISLQLARTKAFPEGSAGHAYIFHAPLDEAQHIDAEAWKSMRKDCTVERRWNGDPPQHGFLVHRPGGVEGATWGFDYDPKTSSDDEAGFRFGDHRFEIGDYVSIRDPEGELHPFKVVDVELIG